MSCGFGRSAVSCNRHHGQSLEILPFEMAQTTQPTPSSTQTNGMQFPAIRTAWAARLLPLLFLLILPAAVQAQFDYVTNDDNTITITGYTGPGGDVTIPNTINGLPVTFIGDYAFYN